MLETTRTYRVKIVNHQVSDGLDQCGFSASKLWNVARYYTHGRWDEDGEIPDDGDRVDDDLVSPEPLLRVHSFSDSWQRG